MELDSTLKMTMITLKMLGIDGFSPDVSESSEWTRWQTNFGPFTCAYCAEMHGDIFHKDNPPEPMPGEVHPNCNCTLIVLLCIKAGTATIAGLSGADYYIKYYGLLPENYLSKDEARAVGWKRYKGNLRDVTSNGTIGGDIYRNRNNNLPTAAGRIWYEADTTKSKMSPASIGGGLHLLFSVAVQSATEMLNDGAKPLIETIQEAIGIPIEYSIQMTG